MITVVAMPLATSPALYPPMPSASTTRPLAASAAIESSLCERTMPGSVQVAISRAWVRSVLASELNVDAGAAGLHRDGGAQRAAELLAGLEALVGILAERAVEEGDQRVGNGRVDGLDVGGRLV